MQRISVAIVLMVFSCLVPVSAQETSTVAGGPSEMIPIADSISVLREHIEKDPEDGKAYLLLGNIYSFAYAFDRRSSLNPEAMLAEMHWGPSAPMSSASLLLPVSSQRIQYLAESVRMHQEAVALRQDNQASWLGLGYACAEAARRCTNRDWPRDRFPFVAQADYGQEAPRYWEDRALVAYRKARELIPPEEEPYVHDGCVHEPPTQPDWGAAGILQVYGRRVSLSAKEKAELQNGMKAIYRQSGKAQVP